MPPRIPSAALECCRAAALGRPSTTPRLTKLTSLVASLTIKRNANILADLRHNKGHEQKRIRVGRGASSGYGKTSGRGHKGQGQHGKVKPWFQGGQTPLMKAKGKLGFKNPHADVFSLVNVDKLQSWIDAGRLDTTKQITPRELIKSNLVGSIRDGIKLLARGGTEALKQPIDICVSRASGAAIEAVEAAGGRVVTRYYTRQSIRNLVLGRSVHTEEPLPVGAEYVGAVQERMRAARKQGYMYRLPDPTSRWDMEYYRDPAHRGYLSHQLEPGENPSLYYRIPPAVIKKKRKVDGDQKEKKIVDSKRLWEALT